MATKRTRQQKAGSSERPDIFRFHDYRLFLKEWLEYLRATDGSSLRSLSKKARLSCAYLPLVVSGKRNLSPKAEEALGPFLRLTLPERKFLSLLRILSDTHSPEARHAAFEEIRATQAYRRVNPKEIEVYRYLEKWYYVAIRELASLPDFNADPTWIQNKLSGRITPGQAKEAVQFLLESGFIEKRSDGRIRPTTRDIECVGGIFRLALRNFHGQMLELSAEEIRRSPTDQDRFVMGYTLAVAPDQMGALREIIQRAINEIESLGTKTKKADAIYHATFLAIPLTEKSKEDRSHAQNK